MKLLSGVWLAAGVLAGICVAGVAHAQQGSLPMPPPVAATRPGAMAPIDPSQIEDPVLRQRMERLIQEKGLNRRPIVESTSEPWLGPTGEQLVGIVNDRMMTINQLHQRVGMLLQDAEPLQDAQLESDRRVMYESQVLAQWVENTALAVYAEKLGMTATDAEVDKALADLEENRYAKEDGSPVLQKRNFVGFREADLRQEVHDGLLVEKVVRKGIHIVLSEEQEREIFKSRPDLFIRPTRVKAWQIYYPISRVLSGKEEDQVMDQMNDLRKKLRRAETPEDYAALKKQLGTRQQLVDRDRELLLMRNGTVAPSVALGGTIQPVMADLGWVAKGDMLPEAVEDKIFKLDPGDTSDVIQSRLGYHVVKVVDRVEGEKSTFEQAKPRIENMMFDHVKDSLYLVSQRYLTIYSDSGGLRKWHKITPEQATMVASAGTSVTTAEPNLDSLRADMEALRKEKLKVPSVEEVLRQNAAIHEDERALGTSDQLPPSAGF